MTKKLVIIDTDCGIDDAQAIMMALAAPDVEILGVTCVFGNAAVEDVCQNVLRVLSICEREGVRLWKLCLNEQLNNLAPSILKTALRCTFSCRFQCFVGLLVLWLESVIQSVTTLEVMVSGT